MRIHVKSQFIPEQSDVNKSQFFYAYHVKISNVGGEPVKLLRRHWIITDAFGREEHVRGDGVVGEQPRLEPGESFEYTSACPLKTPHGAMKGTYQMVTDDGESFDARIAPFALARPEASN